MRRRRRYYYNADAIREPASRASMARWAQDGPSQAGSWRANGGAKTNGPMRAVGGPYKTDKQRGHGRRHAGFNDRWDAMEKAERFGRSRAGVSANGYEARKWQDRSDGRSRPPMTMIDREYHPLGRNRRTVWTIATQPFPGAHFATFPTALVEPCILAGSRPGDVVLDPFAGAGTTGLVANRLGRAFLGIELSPAYCAMARRRIEGDAPLLNREP